MLFLAAMVLVAGQATNASPSAPPQEQPPEVEIEITVSATRTGGRLEGRNINGGVRFQFLSLSISS